VPKDRKKLTLSAIVAITKNKKEENKSKENKSRENKSREKKVKLKDLEKFSKSVRFPLLWREEIEKNIDYPTDLSSFIVEAIKEKMEREKMNTFIG